MSPPPNWVELYQAVFRSPQGKRVLDDLRTRFHDCRALQLTPCALAYQEGRRAVWQHIAATLNGQVYQPVEETHESDRDDTD